MRNIVLVLSLVAIGCGGPSAGSDSGTPGGSGGSCDLRTTAMYCQHYAFGADALAVYEQACTDNSGTWIDGECPRAGALGGCRGTQAGFGDLTNWFYVGGPYTEASQVEAACASSSPPGTFVAP